MILTGGTTGKFKVAAHKPSVFNFLNPFLVLIERLSLFKYHTAYIATPVYHGYGVAFLLLFIAMGKKTILTRRFDADRACSMIQEYRVEVATVVPLMIYKMLKINQEALKSLACIISGGAELNPKLVDEVLKKLGDVLYNLYGTSEAGLNIIAAPGDLRYSAGTVGKSINGVSIKIIDENKKEVKEGKIGWICIRNRWSMKNKSSSWIETGDLGYRDSKGYYFLCGRSDDMIVSAGENVYPADVEKLLLKHPLIEDAAVIGIRDELFGQRLKAYVLPVKNAGLTEEELLEWLHSNAARFQIPKCITFVDKLPYTAVGKLDRKQLK